MKQDLNNMMCLDVYLSSKKTDKFIDIDNTLEDECSKMMPLISWDMFSDQYFKTLNAAKKCMDLKKIKSYAKKYKWKNDIESLFQSVDFSTIVLTNKKQKIIWVNEEFTSMTGYTKKEALEKTAGFLQGPKTSKKTKAEIEFRLKENKPFQTTLINYRKNKSEYICEVHIFPLYNNKKTTTHFIAL
jgi:PAS domain S-box-containing protein